MNPTVANIVEQARMAYLALRTGDYMTAFPSVPFGIMVRLAAHDLAPQEANDAHGHERVHEDDVFLPTEDGLTEFTLGH